MDHALIDASRLTHHIEATLADETALDSYAIAALLVNTEHAQKLVRERNRGRSLNRNTENLVYDLESRLANLHTRIKQKQSENPIILKSRPKIEGLQPIPMAMPKLSPTIVETSTEKAQNEDRPLKLDHLPTTSRPDESELLPRTALRRRKALEAATAINKPTVATSEDSERILQHHRSVQDSLTADLQQMATQLKNNSLHFSQNLQKDKTLLTQVEDSMGQGLTGMQKERTRLGAYTRKGGWTTCYVVMAMAGVAAAWFFMFALIRIT